MYSLCLIKLFTRINAWPTFDFYADSCDVPWMVVSLWGRHTEKNSWNSTLFRTTYWQNKSRNNFVIITICTRTVLRYNEINTSRVTAVTKRLHVRLAKTQISVWSESSLSTWRCFGSFGALRKHAYSNILKNLQPKKRNFFQIKNSDIFHISAQNIDCGYSLEPPQRGGSNEYPQSMLFKPSKKNNVYPLQTPVLIYKSGG